MALNKLAFHNVLVRDMDMPSEAAEELADIVDEATDDLATKEDLAAMEARLRLDFQMQIQSLTRWMIGMWGSVIAALVALTIAVLIKGL